MKGKKISTFFGRRPSLATKSLIFQPLPSNTDLIYIKGGSFQNLCLRFLCFLNLNLKLANKLKYFPFPIMNVIKLTCGAEYRGENVFCEKIETQSSQKAYFATKSYFDNCVSASEQVVV